MFQGNSGSRPYLHQSKNVSGRKDQKAVKKTWWKRGGCWVDGGEFLFILFLYSSFLHIFLGYWQATVQGWLWHAPAGGDRGDKQGGGGQHHYGHYQQYQLDWTILLNHNNDLIKCVCILKPTLNSILQNEKLSHCYEAWGLFIIHGALIFTALTLQQNPRPFSTTQEHPGKNILRLSIFTWMYKY